MHLVSFKGIVVKVSVAFPCCSAEDYAVLDVEHLLNKFHAPDEIFVVDDRSMDGNIDFIRFSF